MARDRQRAKQRRARRRTLERVPPDKAPERKKDNLTPEDELARTEQTARHDRADDPDASPDPLAHASAEVDEAEAQLARSAAQAARLEKEDATAEAEAQAERTLEEEARIENEAPVQDVDALVAYEESLEDKATEQSLEGAEKALGRPRPSRGRGGQDGGGGGGGEVAAGDRPPPARRGETVAGERPRPLPLRFVSFLRASWAELQRVQWPDRRAVTQATAVVVVFVLIAATYLGIADWVAQRVVNAIIG